MPDNALSVLPPIPDLGRAPNANFMPANNAPGANPLLSMVPPAPSHAETVATLRHLQAQLTGLRSLLKNPNLGKSDLKGTIIDSVTRLVASRLVPPSDAVAYLAGVPDAPPAQKKWAMQEYQQAVQARDAVLDHHRAANPARGDLAAELMAPRGSIDDHQATIRGMLQAHYPGGGNG
jgi:hypothetical protein